MLTPALPAVVLELQQPKSFPICPAAERGVRVGDCLLSVDGTNIAGLEFAYVNQLLQRSSGTVTMHFVRGLMFDRIESVPETNEPQLSARALVRAQLFSPHK